MSARAAEVRGVLRRGEWRIGGLVESRALQRVDHPTATLLLKPTPARTEMFVITGAPVKCRNRRHNKPHHTVFHPADECYSPNRWGSCLRFTTVCLTPRLEPVFSGYFTYASANFSSAVDSQPSELLRGFGWMLSVNAWSSHLDNLVTTTHPSSRYPVPICCLGTALYACSTTRLIYALGLRPHNVMLLRSEEPHSLCSAPGAAATPPSNTVTDLNSISWITMQCAR